MRKIAFIIAAAALPCQAIYAQEATGEAVAHAEDTPAFSAALELAEVLNSPALMRVQFDKLFDETFPRSFAANSEMVALETTEPGILKEMLAAMRPILEEDLRASLPELWNDLAKIYAAELQASEIKEVTAFYRSEVGQHLVAAMGEGMDFSTAVSKSLLAPDDELQEQDLTAGLMAGVAGLSKRLTPEDYQAIIDFTSKSPGSKLATIAPKTVAETTRWSNRADPETEAEVQAAVDAVVQRRLAQKEE